MASVASAPAQRLRAERRFYSGMALVVLASTFIGFAPSYYLRGVIPAPHPFEPLIASVHLHGLVFSAWILLFVAQTSLVAAGRVDLHRKLGVLGMVLLALMIPIAIYSGFNGVNRPLTAPPPIDPRSWAALPLLDTPVFAGLAIAGLLNRRNPQTHKRLMLLCMIDMLHPSLGRTVAMLGGDGLITILAVLIFLVPLIVWDLRTRGKLHKATLWGGLLITARLFVTPLIWTQQWWMDFTEWGARALT